MESTDVKMAFAERLCEVCDDMGVVAERGRQTALALEFRVSPNAARKWLLGQGMPELDMAIRIANWGGVNVIWLLQGVGPKRGDIVDTSPGELLEAVQALPDDRSQQVLDFIGYQIEKSEGWFTGENLTRYMALLDKFKENARKGKR